VPAEDPREKQADATGQPTITVKSESLGILRFSHPLTGPLSPRVGDVVVQGQLLALLQIGVQYTRVVAPANGVIETVLTVEGTRVDYGMGLFSLRVAKS
jgi:biotin carboxyl carrier protein